MLRDLSPSMSRVLRLAIVLAVGALKSSKFQKKLAKYTTHTNSADTLHALEDVAPPQHAILIGV